MSLHSLLFLILLISSVVASIYFVILFRKFGFQSLKLLFAIIIVTCGTLVLVEIIGQIYVYNHPSYLVLNRVPDRVIGWKSVPNFEFIHTGNHWYSRDYSAQVRTNSLGFRDSERSPQKPDNTIRIALLGDSMVEALEVPFDKTAGQLLEKKLNNDLQTPSRNYEVLNFGMGAFGITQSLLNYTEYVQIFNPDYVFLFVVDSHIWRSVGDLYCSTATSTSQECLRVRPTAKLDMQVLKILRNILKFDDFHQLINRLVLLQLEDNKKFPFALDEYKNYIEEQKSQIKTESIKRVSEELKKAELFLTLPLEYDKFVEAQSNTISDDFNSKRIIEHKAELFVREIFSQIKEGLRNIKKLGEPLNKEFETLVNIYRTVNHKHPISGNPNFPNFEGTIYVNLKILEVLNKVVQKNKGKLIFECVRT